MGKLVAVCTSETMTGVGDKLVINQPAPMSCIQVPMFDAMVASHKVRNSGMRNGAQADSLCAGEAPGLDRSFMQLLCRNGSWISVVLVFWSAAYGLDA